MNLSELKPAEGAKQSNEFRRGRGLSLIHI